MADYYLDSSGLAKRYVNETGSTWVRGLYADAGNNIHVAAITSVELTSAIARRVRGGLTSGSDARAALTALKKDWQGRYQTVQITDGLLAQATVFAEQYALRGYDAVQLAAACQVNALLIRAQLSPLTLISADSELNAAAISEGLVVDDPNNYP